MTGPLADAEALSAEELLAWAVERFHPRLALACSFQKEEAVLLDLLLTVQPRARVFALDTGVLFDETYETWRRVEERYGVRIEPYAGPTLAEQAAEHGEALWARAPDRCCALRKVEPLSRALSGLDAWITGVRREQAPTRAGSRKLEWDERHGLWKLNPLADWTETQLWARIAERELPYNPLHDRGYESIGCTHCTRPGAGRAGRWAGNEKTECGLHT
ncbi:MAG TPA: phosphoadenylyl-sulfate reductase [Solirubrobacteraceae bacterium]|nr:phosphoadenylyl-sulfate reductase [Solirubrobacteraceae bacterium]